MTAPAEDRVIERHGNTTYAACLDCGERYEIDALHRRFRQEGDVPDCACGGFKTATVSFGQAMPQEAMRKAAAAALWCDLFLVLGSSLAVYPAAGFPLLAKRNGARLVIVNRAETDFDSLADLVIHGAIGATLPAASRAFDCGRNLYHLWLR